jgi:hypothetical protein
MRRGTGFARGSLARLAKARRRRQTRGPRAEFAMALGRRWIGGFEIAEKERFAYPFNDLEGLAHGAAGPRNLTMTNPFTRKKIRELPNR